MKKPTWFQGVDVAFIAGLAIGLGMIALLVASGAPLSALIGLGLVVVIFGAIWLAYIQKRRAWLADFVWLPYYGGFMVRQNGFRTSIVELADAIHRTVEAWSVFHPEADQKLKKGVVWVFFERGLDEGTKFGFKAEGFTFARSQTMWVDFDQWYDSIESTSFEHELGHIIHGNATGSWDQNEHHEFAQKNGLK